MANKRIKTETFGNVLTGEAKVTLSACADGRYVVGRYLPSGLDLHPSGYWFDDESSASAKFGSVCKYVESLGFARAA